METDNNLEATFFSDCLDFRGLTKPDRITRRTEWFTRSLEAMADKDVVCVDPDNGLVVPSAKGRPKENKYVLPEELASYYAQGSTVVCYQHKARRKDPFYARQFKELGRLRRLPRRIRSRAQVREGIAALLPAHHPAQAPRYGREEHTRHAHHPLG